MNTKVALFAYGEERFALFSNCILQILPPGALHPLPLMRRGFQGILVYRDEPVPLIALTEFFPDRQAFGSPPHQYTLICGTDSGMVGLPATRILQIVDRDQGALADVQEGEAESSPCDLVFWFKDQRFLLLDLDDLIASLPDVEKPVLPASRRHE